MRIRWQHFKNLVDFAAWRPFVDGDSQCAVSKRLQLKSIKQRIAIKLNTNRKQKFQMANAEWQMPNAKCQIWQMDAKCLLGPRNWKQAWQLERLLEGTFIASTALLQRKRQRQRQRHRQRNWKRKRKLFRVNRAIVETQTAIHFFCHKKNRK